MEAGHYSRWVSSFLYFGHANDKYEFSVTLLFFLVVTTLHVLEQARGELCLIVESIFRLGFIIPCDLE